MNPWALPVRAEIGGRSYDLHTDYRDILEIISYLEDPDRPEYLRWRIALGLFFEQPVPPEDQNEAMEYLADFIAGGQREGRPGPRLLSWEQDAAVIIADVNRVAGTEIRALPYMHWWTFLAWFHAIGEGRLSTLVGIRDKLRRGKKLEKWEQEYYRENKAQVDLRRRPSREEEEERQRLLKILE